MKTALCLAAMLMALASDGFASVNVASPANGSTVTSPVHYSATASSTCAKGIAAMGVYVNNQRMVVQNGASLNANITLSSGSYRTVVQEWDNCGGSTVAPVSITVSGSQTGGSGVVVTTPANNSTVASPVQFQATATTSTCAQGVAAMGIYIDNKLTYTVNGAAISTALPIAAGIHHADVQEWDHCGGALKTAITLTVGGSTATTVQMTASPTSISAGGSSVLSVTASNATRVTISGSNGTSYTLPNGGGQVTVTPKATTTYTATATGANGNASSVATVTVGASNGPTATVTANPTAISAGGSSVIDVMATNSSAVKVTGSDGSSYLVPWDGGSHTVYPKATTTYTATVTGPNGTATAEVTVSVGSGSAPSGNAVLMHHNDLAGDGANTSEVILTPANVTSTNFGRKFALPVDGQIYAQPLYVPGLAIGGTTHNTVFAATQNDSVYAFDSDNGAQLWKVSLGTPVANNDPEGVQPTLGILSTPVIDPNTSTMYVTGVDTGRVLKLHALDITTGAEKFGGPVTVTASVPGTGSGSVNGMVPLSAGCYQRTGLTLANGYVYLGFGHCNHGWMLAYSANTLALAHVLNTSPNGVGATIWMGGAAPVVDANGDLYVISADDIGSTAPSSNDFPDAFLKLSPSLQVLDSFIPSNERYLESNDADLGSGAPIVMPDNSSSHPHEVIGGGKDGRVFVVNRDSMGGYNAGGTNANLQTMQTGTQQFDNIWGAPAFWNETLYYHTEGDVLRSYAWNAQGNAGLLSGHSAASGNVVYLNHGASPSISANGTSNGIVWDVDNSGYPQNGGSGGTPAILHAYDANDVGQELYNSSQAANGRDTAGHACKFSVPTVTDGKVFVPTCTELDIYGLLK